MSGRSARLKTTAARASRSKFPFVVQIVVPDGGFGCTLGAINAWHRYSKTIQRRGPPQPLGERVFWNWCFEGLEIAKVFRHRFGGQIVPITIRSRRDFARRGSAPANSECEKEAANSEREPPSSD
jgi:hypothetical protein